MSAPARRIISGQAARLAGLDHCPACGEDFAADELLRLEAEGAIDDYRAVHRDDCGGGA